MDVSAILRMRHRFDAFLVINRQLESIRFIKIRSGRAQTVLRADRQRRPPPERLLNYGPGSALSHGPLADERPGAAPPPDFRI
ncbi:hypothetical protein B1812_11900 [Methylocystis bryophila]|uniref:Uncharacterized protein n=1 Tax=Methylocystis bryophila TaxID=655015 RepID=A0A1W6MVM8_9HYPH|nr:hypothetical protein B1812_11900 [Methylocystis bryophila]